MKDPRSVLWFLMALSVVWGIGSWYYYTCPIKGFCGTKEVVVPLVGEGACPAYLTSAIRLGAINDGTEVAKLQTFLNVYEAEQLPVDGTYSAQDDAAVKRYQAKYAPAILAPLGNKYPTGHVLSMTRNEINRQYCAYQAAAATN